MTKRPLCHRSEHQICNTQTKFSKMMLCIDHERAQQENTCKQIQEILSENFRVTHFPIRHNLRNIGRVLTQKKILDLIRDFDVFAIFLNDPGLDFNFYKKLKIKNPLLTIVYIEGDSEILFPTYSQLLIKHIDLFVSFDSLDAVDVTSQQGCRSICLGNLISQKDFYHIKNTKKKYDVLFYGGTKYKGSDREKILDFLKKKKIPIMLIGKSFGYISGCELNQKINQSRIVISLNKSGYNPRNIVFPKNYKIGMHLKSKIFEPMLCKTFVLCEKIENFDRFYKPKEELVSFTDKYDLIKKIKFYLNNPKIRERISKNAHF
ncbi:glycosyltransferase, partial [Rickettsiales bacterium]|nr:glycosyltransferase [Rickettsiales bacterium]